MRPESQQPRIEWRRGRKGRFPKHGDTLTLAEVVMLRRLKAGESQTDIARARGVTGSTVSQQLRGLRTRFGVPTNDELIALPRVQEQLDAGTEPQP